VSTLGRLLLLPLLLLLLQLQMLLVLVEKHGGVSVRACRSAVGDKEREATGTVGQSV